MEFIPAKTMLSYAKGEHWFGIDYNMNIYKGCCHGCIYCDSRSSCYGIESFDEVKAKKDALLILHNELRRKVKTGIIGTGAMSDPYNPFEKQYGLTRGALELINQYGFGVAIATKSPLITRDIDILKAINNHSPVIAKITITAYKDDLCKIIEPRVAPSSERFKAIKALAEAGIFTGVLMMPVLPFIADNEENIKSIVVKAAASGARFIYPAIGMTLRENQREWYFEKLDQYFPGIKEEYIQHYGNQYECRSVDFAKLRKLFVRECEKYGLLYKMPDIIKAIRKNHEVEQLSLF